VCFIPDNNILALHSVLATLGVASEANNDVTFTAVRRDISEVRSPICAMIKKRPEERKWVTVVPDVAKPYVWANNKVKDQKDGQSDYPDATGTMVCELPTYIGAISSTEGVQKDFFDPMWKDQKKGTLKNPASLLNFHTSVSETYPAESRSGFLALPEWMCEAKFVNGFDEAKDLLKKGGLPLHTPAQAEASLYYYYRRMLAMMNARVEVDVKEHPMGGIPIQLGARIILDPSFAINIATLRTKFIASSENPPEEGMAPDIGVQVTNRSTLVLAGHQLSVAGLILDGALVVKAISKAEVLIEDLEVNNPGWQPERIKESKRKRFRDGAQYLVRGYKCITNRDLVCEYDRPGVYELFRQTQRGRPVGGEPEPVEPLRPVTASSTAPPRSATPRGKTPNKKSPTKSEPKKGGKKKSRKN
jgi:hypothetical protein